MSGVIANEKQLKDMLTVILETIDVFEERRSKGLLELDFVAEKMEHLQKTHPQEYLSYDLANIGLTYVIPLMKVYLASSWRPVDVKRSDDDCRVSFQRWRTLLEFQSKPSDR